MKYKYIFTLSLKNDQLYETLNKKVKEINDSFHFEYIEKYLADECYYYLVLRSTVCV